MKKSKAEVIVILDRSGSMSTIKSDVEGGFKTFIDKQKKEPGECFVSLYQFDTEYEAVFENQDIQDLGKMKLEPRGGTALLDAIGRTINKVGERLRDTKEKDRPESVIILIMTDGQENSSREFTKSKIKQMVEHQRAKYNWHFVFVGSNQDAILTGADYGFIGASSLSFANSTMGVSATYSALSKGVSSMRSCNQSYAFSEAERAAAMDEAK